MSRRTAVTVTCALLAGWLSAFPAAAHPGIGIVQDSRGWLTHDAADRGAGIVCVPEAYYEKAMLCRSRENTIYFASVNDAPDAPEAATSVSAPSGECQASLPHGEEGVFVQPIDLSLATGLLARRYAPDRYEDEASVRPGGSQE